MSTDPRLITVDAGRGRKAWYTYWAVIVRHGVIRAWFLTDASRRRFKAYLLAHQK